MSQLVPIDVKNRYAREVLLEAIRLHTNVERADELVRDFSALWRVPEEEVERLVKGYWDARHLRFHHREAEVDELVSRMHEDSFSAILREGGREMGLPPELVERVKADYLQRQNELVLRAEFDAERRRQNAEKVTVFALGIAAMISVNLFVNGQVSWAYLVILLWGGVLAWSLRQEAAGADREFGVWLAEMRKQAVRAQGVGPEQ